MNEKKDALRKKELATDAKDRFVPLDESETRKKKNLEFLMAWKASDRELQLMQKVCPLWLITFKISQLSTPSDPTMRKDADSDSDI